MRVTNKKKLADAVRERNRWKYLAETKNRENELLRKEVRRLEMVKELQVAGYEKVLAVLLQRTGAVCIGDAELQEAGGVRVVRKGEGYRMCLDTEKSNQQEVQ